MTAIVITAYNRKDFIEKAVLSLLNQKGVDIEDFELIFSVNFDINYLIEKHKLNEKFTKVNIAQASTKIGETLANGIQKAKSKDFFFLEDDDMFTEDHMEKILEFRKQIEKDSYAIHNLQYFIDGKNNPIKLPINYDAMKWHNVSSFYIHFVSSEEKEEFIDILKNVELAPDLAIYIYFLNKNAYFEIPERLTYFRVHSANTSLQQNHAKLLHIQKDDLYLYRFVKNKQVKKLLKNSMFHNAIILNTIYNENFPVSIKYMDLRVNSIVKYILYRINRNLLKNILLNRYEFTDL